MSDETKNDLIVAFVLTASVVLLVIIFGNTGSGFFRNLMVFIVGSIIGTPMAIAGKFVSSLFTDNELYKYGSFAWGAVIGAALASMMFSNKLETSFISQCTHNYNLSKAVCECTYKKFEDKYEDNLETVLKASGNEETTSFMLKSIKGCQ